MWREGSSAHTGAVVRACEASRPQGPSQMRAGEMCEMRDPSEIPPRCARACAILLSISHPPCHLGVEVLGGSPELWPLRLAVQSAVGSVCRVRSIRARSLSRAISALPPSRAPRLARAKGQSQRQQRRGVSSPCVIFWCAGGSSWRLSRGAVLAPHERQCTHIAVVMSPHVHVPLS